MADSRPRHSCNFGPCLPALEPPESVEQPKGLAVEIGEFEFRTQKIDGRRRTIKPWNP